MSYNDLLLDSSVTRCAHLVAVTEAVTLDAYVWVDALTKEDIREGKANVSFLKFVTGAVLEAFNLSNHEYGVLQDEIIRRVTSIKVEPVMKAAQAEIDV